MIHCVDAICPNLNESYSVNLDTQFQNILTLIKPFVLSFKEEKYVHICKAWIEKLCKYDSNEKVLRNKYMKSLWDQISRGFLQKPFLSNPPPGKLEEKYLQASSEYSETVSFISSSTPGCQCRCKEKTKHDATSSSPPTSIRSIFHPDNKNAEEMSQGGHDASISRNKFDPAKITPFRSKSDTHIDDHHDEEWKKFIRPYRRGMLKQIQSTPIENDSTDKGDEIESEKNTQTPTKFFDSKHDTDPVVRFRNDLSENFGSTSTLFNDGHTYLESKNDSANLFGSFGSDIDSKYIDTTLKRRLAELSVIYELRSKKLTEKLGKSQKQMSLMQDELQQLKKSFKEMTMAEKRKHASIVEENALLRRKTLELEDLQSSQRHQIPSTVGNDNLSDKLVLVQAENTQLARTLDELTKKVAEVEQSNAQELNILSMKHMHEKTTMEDDHRQDILNVMRDCDEKYQQLERTCNQQLREYQKDHEGNIQRLSKANIESFQEYRLTTDNLIAERDAEITRLESVVHQQWADLQSEVVSMRSLIAAKCSNEECNQTRADLLILQKVVKKLRKTIKGLLLHLDKDVLDIFKDKKMQESDMKFNLMKQKAEITVKIFSESQTELKKALQRIDERFRSNITAIKREIEGNNTCDEECCINSKNNSGGCCKKSCDKK